MENTTLKNIACGLLQKMNATAVIFDLDGTLIDNNSFHRAAWIEYLKHAGIYVSEEEYKKNFNGRTNKDVIEYIYKRKMGDDEAMRYTLEKESLYREMYASHIRPVKGLIPLLQTLAELQIPMAIATSGIQVNIDFMFEHLSIREYFKVILNAAHISNGKPDPEIYLKTAATLRVQPCNCLVFEDAVVGIIAAKKAGMKVAALTTTQTREELSGADLLLEDFDLCRLA